MMPSRLFMTRISVPFLLLILGTASAAAADPVESLHAAISARLLLMADVARYKWNAQLPIADPEREAVLLERTTATAVTLGLPEDYARRVLAAQFEASRTLQAALFARWRVTDQGGFVDVPDLIAVQRPAIERATTALLAALAGARCELEREGTKTAFEVPPVALADASLAWSIATAALWLPETTPPQATAPCEPDQTSPAH
jgi:chorismate mutase-like protein